MTDKTLETCPDLPTPTPDPSVDVDRPTTTTTTTEQAVVVVDAPSEPAKEDAIANTNTTLSTALARPPTFSQRWTRTMQTLHQPYVQHVLHPVTQRAARNPRRTMLAVVVGTLALLVAGIFTNFHLESDGDHLWTPTGVRTTAHRDYIHDTAASGYDLDLRGINVLLYTTTATATTSKEEEDGNGNDDDNGNVLLHAHSAVEHLFTLLDTVRNLPGYQAACRSHPTRTTNGNVCEIQGATKFFNHSAAIFDATVQTNEQTLAALSAPVYPDGTRVSLPWIAGFAKRNPTTGMLIRAASLSLQIEWPDTDAAVEFEKKALDALLDVRRHQAWQTENGRQHWVVQILGRRSIDDEIERAIVQDIPLVPIVFMVMGCFTAAIFSRRHAVQSRSLLGWTAVVSVLLSITSGYGLMFCCGVPFTSMTQILPFVIFGIGLDDTFVMMGAYSSRTDASSTEQRIHQTIQDVGTSITLTTITSMLAFGLGCLSSVPAVYWLCLYAIPTIAFVYIYQLTFFVAAMVLDERRIAQNRRDICPCLTVPGEDRNTRNSRTTTPTSTEHNQENESARTDNQADPAPEQVDASAIPTPNILERFIDWYADFLLQPSVKVTVVVSFATLLGLCIWSALQLTIEFNVVDVMPSDSYASDFLTTQKVVTERAPIDAYVYFRNVNQSLPEVQAQMKTYIQDLVALEEIPRAPDFFWLYDFETFVADEANGVSVLPFVQQLDAFLAREEFALLYADDIARDADSGEIHGSRVIVFLDNVDIEDVHDQVDALEAVDDVTKAQPANQGRGDYSFFIYEGIFQIWEFYAACVDELILTTILGVVTVTGVALLFIPHWTAALFVLPLISILYLDLLGVMQWGGVHIDPVSYVACVMSIGLLVDFILHILLRYYECPGNRREKTVATLKSMGVSILTGGISTFLGAMPLIFSTSTVFSTIFIAFLGLSTLGVGHGLILLPVILSTIGPEEQIVWSEQELPKEAKVDETNQFTPEESVQTA